MAEQLQKGDIMLRAPEPEDLDVMFQFENATDLWEVSNTTGPYSRFQLKQYIEQTQNDLFADRQLRLMIEKSNKTVVGIIDICHFDPIHSRAEVGVVIHEKFRHQGIAHKALALLEGHCFYHLGIHQMFAYVAVTNTPSRNLFKSCGFEECALLKSWMRVSGGYDDVVIFQKINPIS